MNSKLDQSSVLQGLASLPLFANDANIIKLDSNGKPIQLDKVKSISKYIAWVLILVLGYFVAVNIQSIVTVLGLMLGAVAIGITLVCLMIWLPNIIDWTRRKMIESDPFLILDRHLRKLDQMAYKFKLAKQKIRELYQKAKEMGYSKQQERDNLKDSLAQDEVKVKEIMSKIDNLRTSNPDGFRGDDRFHRLELERQKLAGEITIKMARFNSANELVMKYGQRANTLNEVGKKLDIAEIGMDIKKSQMETSIDILKADYEFAKTGKEATSSAKTVLGLTNSMEADYAMKYVTQRIGDDINAMMANFSDIEKITKSLELNFDSDSTFAKLSNLNQSFLSEDNLFSVKVDDYKNPDRVLTTEEKLAGGRLSGLF